MRISWKWAAQVLLSIDQFANTVIGGHADETISARSYRMAVVHPSYKRRWRIARRFIDALFFWENDHTLNAYLSERDRAHMPGRYRQNSS